MTRTDSGDFYGGRPPGELPAYTMGETAHWLGLAPATVRSWCVGQHYHYRGSRRFFKPALDIADPAGKLLSFQNLVELHVLAAIRREHQVSLQTVRKAVLFMSSKLGVEHPLASRRLLTDGKDLLIEYSGELLNLSQAGQLEMRRVVELYLSRVDHSEVGEPIRLYPFTTSALESAPRSVVINPTVQWGRPCLAGTGVPTAVIAERFKAGEQPEQIAADYDRETAEVLEAVRHELKLAA